MSPELREYVEGYRCGQHDVINWLVRGADGDWPLAPIDERVQSRAWAWCLAHNLTTVAFGERCFDLGRFAGAYEVDEYDRPQPWTPGRGLSTDHDCKDCGAPLLTDDVAQGFTTCEQCAAERRAAR